MKRNVLIVDDDQTILSVIKDFLTEQGYLVFTAENGIEALDVVKHESIPVMFIDLNMPKMNGYELCRKIRELKNEAWICAITGVGSVFRGEECINAGFDAYYIKPFNIKLILNEIIKDVFEKIEDKNK